MSSIIEGERDENEVRKDFTASERVAIARAVEAALGERRGNPNLKADEAIPQNFAELRGKETRQIAAERAGFGNPETYRQAKKVVETAVPEVVDAMDSGKVSISAAATIAKRPADEQRRIVAEENLTKAVYDAAKKAARLAKAKGAHDELIAKAHRAQADALEIEAAAKRRLADEYDAAQERGEIRSANKGRSASALEAPSAADIGLTHKNIFEARQVRDAEKADPGIVRRTLDQKLDAGQEPTKAALRARDKALSLIAQGLNSDGIPLD